MFDSGTLDLRPVLILNGALMGHATAETMTQHLQSGITGLPSADSNGWAFC